MFKLKTAIRYNGNIVESGINHHNFNPNPCIRLILHIFFQISKVQAPGT
jgi:hypothetical protein